MTNQTWVKIADIRVDPRMQRDLGNLEPLTKSITMHGLADPIIVTREGLLLSGWRRLAAFEEFAGVSIPAYVVTSFREAIPLLKKEGANNSYTKPCTVSEQIAKTLVWDGYYRPEAEEQNRRIKAARTRKTLNRGQSASTPAPADPGARLPTVAETMADLLDLGRSTYERLRNVVRCALGEDDRWDQEIAKKLVVLLDSGALSPGTAYRGLATGVVPLLEPVTRRRVQDASFQRHALRNAAAQLRGLSIALTAIVELNPELEKGEVAQWEDDLTKARRQITKTISLLRRHHGKA